MNEDRNLIINDNQNNAEQDNTNSTQSVDQVSSNVIEETPVVNKEEKRISGLAIIGVILAFILPPLGLIVSLIAKKDVSSNGEDGKTLAIVGIIVGILGTLVLLSIFIIGMIFNKKVQPQIQSNIILNTACSNVNKDGKYFSENVECKDFVCTFNNNGKKETKDCRARSNYDGTKNIESEDVDTEETLTDDELVDLFG